MSHRPELDKSGTAGGAGLSPEAPQVVEQFQSIVQQAKSKEQPNQPTAPKILQSPWLRKCLPTLAASLLLYSVMFGWLGAVVIVGLVTIHEMGHWLWMKANKCDPQPPVYVPLLGAFVLMKQPPDNEATTAWVAFAGPLVGGLGSAAMYGIGITTNQPTLVLGGCVGFIINLMQLLPARPFDGGLVVAAISRYILFPGTIALIVMAVTSRSPLLFLFSIFSIITLFQKPSRPAPKLEHSGKAQSMAELERELMSSDQPLSTFTSAAFQAGAKPSPAAQSQNKLIPATMRQRVAIGLSYVVLMGALCSLTMMSIWQISSNLRTYASMGVGCLSNLLRLKEESALLVQRSYLYALQNNFQAADQDIARALAISPKDSDAYYWRAIYRILRGQNDQSVSNDLLKACDLSKKESQEAWNATFALLLCGDDDQALGACKRLSPVAAAGVKAIVCERRGQAEQAASYYDVSVSGVKLMYWGPRLRRAFYFLSTGHFDEAKADLDVLQRRPLKHSAITLLEGWCDLKEGRLNEALKAADKALGSKIEDIDLLHTAYLNAACHRLKAEVFSRKSQHEQNPATAKKEQQMAADELQASGKIAGFGSIYIPRQLESWK